MLLRKVSIVMVCAALALPALSAGDEPKGSLSPNVLLTITVSNGGDSPDKTYRLLARGDNSKASLMTGWRVPIPTTTSSGEEDGVTCGSTTAYTYQNVGLTAQVRARVMDDVVALLGEIEVSTAETPTRDRNGTPTAPTIGTFQQQFSVLLTEQAPLELASVASPEGQTLQIRLEADILN